MTTVIDVDAYIAEAPAMARAKLQEVRRLILDAVPDVVEKIAYGMPSYKLAGRRLVHFSAARKHVGIYGLVHVDGDVPPDLAPYLDHRSTLQLPFDAPLPSAAPASALRRKAATL